jgi:hypothetical protein
MSFVLENAMKLKAILAAGALALAASSAHAGVTFYSYGVGAPAGTLVDNFSQDTLGYVPTSKPGSYTWSSNVPWTYVTTGSLSTQYAAPATSATTVDQGQYLAVLAGGTATLTLAKPVTGIEIYVGSLDSYNNVGFNLGFSNGVDYTGTQLGAISGASNGSQTAANTNGIFEFTFAAPVTTLTFTNNTANAFEIASISSVPEPATWAMMLAGLFGIGAAIRFGRRNAAVAAA